MQAAPVAAGLAEVLAAEAAPVDAGQSPSISGMPSVTTTPVAADAGLNPAGVRGATASDAQAVPAPQAPLPVANPRAWAPLLGQHLMHLVQTGDTQATVRVNPPQLGPVELRLELKDSLTHVSFYAHDAQVREALEQSLPRLRELLGAQGLQLGQSHVGDQASQQQQQQPNPDGGSMAGSGDRRGNGRNDGMSGRDETAVVSGAEVVLPVRKLLGGVDHYV
ncbi:MAG: flagellar hook-length control protein FliK [Proteobacteria bacterium]|nr:flagellar hook-length control protein FliK [Pseudomonadota bacterium]